MNKKIYLIFITLFVVLSTVKAQDNNLRQIYDEAEDEYEIGRIEQAKDLLESYLTDFPTNLKVSVYRLLALCCLGLDETTEADQYTTLLLNVDPYYTTSVQDPQRFTELVKSHQAGLRYTITTASSQAEDLREVPVPTTLITEEMIHNSGALNLQEVLAAYVPGMNIIDCNDDINIAMRGIYSNGQEKILIMVNGHRMNSYATNVAAPDFSISLEKIKQIEVLRGPASSIYGGVALTAVVNLITKLGADVDGVKIKAGIGNHGQFRGDILYGKRYFDLDLMMWGSLHRADGEKKDIPEGQRDVREDLKGQTPIDKVIIGRIGETPSYDFGVQLRWKGMQFFYDTHFSQVAAPFTISTLTRPFLRDEYRSFNGYKPSFATNSHHADLSYTHQFGKLNLKGELTFDNSDLNHYQCISDYPIPEFAEAILLSDEMAHVFSYGGLARYINGQERTLGAQLKGDFKYVNNKNHKGSLAFGVEYSHFNLNDMRYQIVYDFTNVTSESHNLQEMGKDHESSYNGFVQLKHQWRSFIFNAGMRYDHKNRYGNNKIDELSPRIALIYLKPKWNLKLSYSKSFVDAPYLYRKTNDFMNTLQNDSDDDNNRLGQLDPERVYSLQLTFAGTEWTKGLNFELNGFFNRANDLIMTNIIDYNNVGKNSTIGLELMANYRRPRFTVDFNLTWLHTIKSNLSKDEKIATDLNDGFDIDTNINANNNTPAIASNVILSWQATQKLKLFTHINFEGKETSYNTNLVALLKIVEYYNIINEQETKTDEDIDKYSKDIMTLINDLIARKTMPARLLFNIGGEYQFGKFTLGLNIRNLFNAQYNRSGMNTLLVPQKGRWWMVNVAYKF